MTIRDIIFRKPFAKRLIIMLIGVIVMGISVTFLNMTNFGVDPCGAFNWGLSRIVGLSFGTTQLLMNAVLLILVLIFDRTGIGFGTIGNMVVVGYTVDFTYFVLGQFGITTIVGLVPRIVVMIIALVIFVFAVGLYVNAGLGAAPYDVMPGIIQKGIKNKFGKEIKFRYVRMSFDLVFLILAIVLKGSAGIITVLMMLTLGPVIEFVSGKMNRILKL